VDCGPDPSALRAESLWFVGEERLPVKRSELLDDAISAGEHVSKGWLIAVASRCDATKNSFQATDKDMNPRLEVPLKANPD